MKRYTPFYLFVSFLLLPFILMLMGSHSSPVHAQEVPTPTPTYDPLAEPFLPENPSDFELGRNLYWHHCMTCHGDVGQGLTDEFRAIWPEEHQNCWGRGCHGNCRVDEGFPIPTVVPALVSEAKLAQFPSQQALYEFLKATHPPQDPGYLEDEQYRAIVRYVFNMNASALDEPAPTPVLTTPPASTPPSELIPIQETLPKPSTIIYVGLGIMLIFGILWGIQKTRRG